MILISVNVFGLLIVLIYNRKEFYKKQITCLCVILLPLKKTDFLYCSKLNIFLIEQ